MRQYAVIRTNRDERAYIWAELKGGKLRQGWGWLDDQDLRALREKRQRGEPLSKDEKAAWRNRRMLADTWNGLQVGDIVIAPNLPEPGRWIIARVSGDYTFDDGNGQDYRHVLPVTPVRGGDGNIAVIDPSAPMVDARLRGTMRTMSRMWSVDHLANAIDSLLAAVEAGADVSVGQTREDRRHAFLADVHGKIGEATWAVLERSYRGAEFEHLLVPLLEDVYGPGNVEQHGGAGEHGADLLVTLRGPLGLRFKVAVQAKLYDGTHYDLHSVEQLRWAYDHHQVQAGVVLTTATETSPEFEAELKKLHEDLGIDVQVWTRDDFLRLLLSHLGRRPE